MRDVDVCVFFFCWNVNLVSSSFHSENLPWRWNWEVSNLREWPRWLLITRGAIRLPFFFFFDYSPSESKVTQSFLFETGGAKSLSSPPRTRGVELNQSTESEAIWVFDELVLPPSLLLLSTTPDTSVVVDVFGWCCVCSHLENDGQHQQQHVANQLNSSPFWCPKLSRSIPRTTYTHNSLAKGLNWSYRPKSLCERVWVDNTRAPFPNSLSLSAESINKPREEATAAAIFQQLSTRVLHGRLIYLMTDWRRREREKENYGVEEKRGSRSRYTSKRSN